MSPATISSRYANFVIVLLLMFPIVINSIKILGNIILLILFILGGYIALKERQNPFRIPELKLLSWLTVGYFMAMLASIIVADGWAAQFHHLGRKLHFLLAPLIALAIYKSNLSISHLLVSLKFGLILVGIITLFQFFSGHTRPAGMINANVFGDLVVAMLFFSVVRIYKETRKEKILSFFAVALGTTAIVLAASRGSWVSFLILFAVYISIIYPRHLKNNRKRQLSLLLFSVISLFVVATQTTVVERIGNAIDNIQDWRSGHTKFTSSGVRMEMWKSGFLAAKDAPWFGYGYRNANEVAAKYATQNHERIASFTHLHNEYITNLVSAGFIGIITFFALLFVPLATFIKGLRRQGKQMYALMGVMLCVGYITFGFSHIAFGEEHMNAFYVLFLSLLLPIMKRQVNLSDDRSL